VRIAWAKSGQDEMSGLCVGETIWLVGSDRLKTIGPERMGGWFRQKPLEGRSKCGVVSILAKRGRVSVRGRESGVL